ncbi:MAG: cytochrome P450 [Chloroflexi bacterium]|nr:cytochrome P450 [Chloroflexota bacterium]
MHEGRFPPGPPDIGSSPIEQYLTYRKFLADPLKRVTEWVAAYGDVMHYKSGDRHQYMVANPDIIREILVRQSHIFIKGSDYTNEKTGLARFMGQGLVTSNGEFWKRQRRLVAPAFHTQRIAAYADTMVNYTLERVGRWQDGDILDVDEEMMQLTLMIVGRTLFDADASTTVNQVKSAVEVVQKASNTANLLPAWVPTPLRIRSRRANAVLDKIVYGFINQRRSTGEDRGDLLSMLLLSQDEDGDRMTDLQVRDEAVTLFLAGHETTANALNWTWWLLAQYPQVEKRLHAELDSALAGKPPTLEDLRRLPYADMVVKESMRLMPPVWSIGRVNRQATEVLGYSFPEWSGAQILIYCVHRHPDIWEQPNEFIPERWAEERISEIPKYAYIPFGGGPRICIGNSFATMEANLLLATIAQRFQLRLIEGVEIVPQPFITMFPRDGLPMRLETRQPQLKQKPDLAAAGH